MGAAVAEANALHKGPVIFLIPQPVLEQVRRAAARGDRDCEQLRLDLFRWGEGGSGGERGGSGGCEGEAACVRVCAGPPRMRAHSCAHTHNTGWRLCTWLRGSRPRWLRGWLRVREGGALRVCLFWHELAC